MKITNKYKVFEFDIQNRQKAKKLFVQIRYGIKFGFVVSLV